MSKVGSLRSLKVSNGLDKSTEMNKDGMNDDFNTSQYSTIKKNFLNESILSGGGNGGKLNDTVMSARSFRSGNRSITKAALI